jgi:hypothetical protein
MVALAVYRLGYVPKPCLAKPMLFAALECFERGDVIGAGVRLREAANRFLIHACDWYGVEVKAKFLTPKAYAQALRKAKHLDSWGFQIMVDIIDAGNKLAHCVNVDRQSVKGGISILFSMMDSEPWAGHERQPVVTSHKSDCDCCDDDDNDGADWWKAGDA